MKIITEAEEDRFVASVERAKQAYAKAVETWTDGPTRGKEEIAACRRAKKALHVYESLKHYAVMLMQGRGSEYDLAQAKKYAAMVGGAKGRKK